MVTQLVSLASGQTFSETIFADSVARLWLIATPAIQQESVSPAPQDTDWMQSHLLKPVRCVLLESPIALNARVKVIALCVLKLILWLKQQILRLQS
jgi:hypothetical protein